MQLLEFKVQGFKSLYDCKLTDLQPINVFHGDNNVGKSNLLEAIELLWRVPIAISKMEAHSNQTHYVGLPPMQDTLGVGEEIFAWNSERRIILRGKGHFARQSEEGEIQIVIAKSASGDWEIDFKISPDELKYDYSLFERSFYRIRSERRLVRETMEPGTAMRPVELPPLDPSGSNLKQWLLWASVSRDPGERRAFERVVRPMFVEPPLSLGTLAPVAAPGQPYDLQLDTAERAGIPIDQLGSGIQQLALLGGMIALSQSWIVAIEEPEINLSWPTQEKLKHTA